MRARGFSLVSNHETNVTSFAQFLKFICLDFFINLVMVGVRVGVGFEEVTYSHLTENDVTSV